MKRFISALTAFCMCASMTVSSLPASALTLSDNTAINALAGELTWSMDDSKFIKGTDEYATIKVYVSGDPGTYGYEFTPLVNGKNLADEGFELVEVVQADGGYGFGSFDFNEKTGHVGAAKGAKDDSKVADNTCILEIYVTPPANAAPGTKYELSFDGLIIGNEAEQKFTAATKNGSITIEGGNGETQAPTQAPTQSNTESLDSKKNSSEWTWYFDDVVYDPASDKDGFGALVKAYVTKDQGTYGFEYTPKIDGKSIAEAGFTLVDASQADGGYSFGSFDFNEEDGHLGGAASKKEDSKVADGTAVVEMYLKPPANAKEGTVYTVSFDGLLVGNYKEEKLYPKSKSGTITIGKGSTPQTTTEPKETTKPTQPTTTQDPGGKTPSLEEKKNADEWTWYFDDVKYNPKNDPDKFGAVITAYVTKDQGTYGYEFTPLINGKTIKEAGFTFVEANQTDEGYSFGSFDFNEDDGHLGGAASKKEDAKLADGTPVVQLNLLPPADAKPGTVYEVSFKGLLIGNYKEEKLYPKTVNGSITIVDTDVQETTEATTEATTKQTDKVEDTTQPTTKQTDKVEDTTQPTTKQTDKVEDTTQPTTKQTDKVEDTTQPTTKNTDPTQAPSKVDMLWKVAKVEAEPGEVVKVPVSVEGNVGFNSYTAKFTVDAGPKAAEAEAGKLTGLDKVFSNVTKMKFGSSDTSSKANVTGDGDVLYLVFTVPSDAKEGTIYNIDFADLNVCNFEMTKLIPKTEAGYIKVKKDNTTTTVPDVKGDAEWVIGTTEVEAGETVKLPVSVKNDKDGLNSFIAKIKPDSKLKVGKAEQGSAYADIKFQPNDDKYYYAGTYVQGLNLKAAGGEGDVFYIEFTVPADAAPGTKYPVDFSSLVVYNGDMAKVELSTQNGWIKVKEPPTTTTTAVTTAATTTTTTTNTTATTTNTTVATTVTTAPVTEAPTKESTTQFVEPVKEIEAEWIIGQKTAKPGEEVDLPITVKGDKTGLNSFIAKLTASLAEGSTGDNVTAISCAPGAAYKGLKFVDNIGKLAFGATYVDGLNVAAAADNSVVFTVKFKVPDNAVEGTKYDINWASLAIESGDMARLVPTRTNGWILVKDDEEPTETTAETTATSTSATTATSTTATSTTATSSTESSLTETTPTETTPTETTLTETTLTETTPTETSSTETSVTSSSTTASTTTETSTETTTTESTTVTTTTTSATTTTTSTTTTTTTNKDDEKSKWPKEGRDSKVTWIVKDVEKDVDGVNSITVDVPVIVDGDEYGLNSYIANLKLVADGQEAYPVAVNAVQGKQYDTLAFTPNNDVMKYAGTATANQLANPVADDNDGVFIVTFKFDDLSKVKFRPDNDGKEVAEYTVDFNGLELYNAGDETVDAYPINPHTQSGTITLARKAREYDKFEYKYNIEGKNLFCFSHDPRPFADVFSDVKVSFRGINTTTGEDSGWVELSSKTLKNFKVYTTADGYETPLAAYGLNAERKEVCYKGLALTVEFEDTAYGNKVKLDANGMELEDANGAKTTDDTLKFVSNAYIGVKGDANLDGTCNAADATACLIYSAALGNTGDPTLNPLAGKAGDELALAMFLADANEEAFTDQTINAADATLMLRYAAAFGNDNSRNPADIWKEMLEKKEDPKYPPITLKIEEWRDANKA